MGQDDQQDGAQSTIQNTSPQPGAVLGAGVPASATLSSPKPPPAEFADAGSGQILPSAVVPPEEQALLPTDSDNLSHASASEPLRDDTAAGLDGAVAEKEVPPGEGEFEPTVALLHLERDGVVVEGKISPATGEGARDLLIRLKYELVKARAVAVATGVPLVASKTVLGLQPDPNALSRQRAAALGHDIDPDTLRCRKCRKAEWACLAGDPCEVRTDAASVQAAAESDGQDPAERADDLQRQGIAVEPVPEPIQEVDYGGANP